ncbi:hypothetical protein BU16DRAFT_567391 [Lophium mytilinum]|uniref:Uncharacterized protein n=1 Tax=Lophium mytilinum TaxID=390894 RepID=A0A6A6QC35_9PEZI|nr:hypothetical protein BU16DRAFT_567391 [Lophium mytilinum]
MSTLSKSNFADARYGKPAIVCSVHDVTNMGARTASRCLCHVVSAFRWLNGPVLAVWEAFESNFLRLDLSGPQKDRMYHIFLTMITKRPAEPCVREALFSALDRWRAVQTHERFGPAATLLRGLLCKVFLHRKLDVPVAKIEQAAYVVEAAELPHWAAITKKMPSGIFEGFPEDRLVIVPVILITFADHDSNTVVFAPLGPHLGLPAVFQWSDFVKVVSKTAQKPKTMDLESWYDQHWTPIWTKYLLAEQNEKLEKEKLEKQQSGKGRKDAARDVVAEKEKEKRVVALSWHNKLVWHVESWTTRVEGPTSENKFDWMETMADDRFVVYARRLVARIEDALQED